MARMYVFSYGCCLSLSCEARTLQHEDTVHLDVIAGNFVH